MHVPDVIVIGAGPAGSIAARDLARSGAAVALVDGSHPREKPCGGGVTARALRVLDLESIGVPSTPVSRIAFSRIAATGRTEQAADVAIATADTLRVYARASLDAAVLSQAVAAGAHHVPARATRIDREASGWIVRAGATDLRARWILGADGAASLVRKQVHRPFDRAQLSIAAGSYVDGVETGSIAIGFTDQPRGYLWSFPRPGHLAVGTCAQADASTSGELHALTDRWLDRYAPAAGRPRRRYAWPIPSLDARAIDDEQPAGDGWLLTGDAAGLVDPITREGIFFALRSGQLAAAALMMTDPTREYDTAVRDELHSELRRAAWLKAGFFRPRFVRLMMDALAQSDRVRGVMVDLVAGRQSYRGLKRRLIGTFELGLMLRLITARDILRAS
jgi:geranylgeranyl reductase family protein